MIEKISCKIYYGTNHVIIYAFLIQNTIFVYNVYTLRDTPLSIDLSEETTHIIVVVLTRWRWRGGRSAGLARDGVCAKAAAARLPRRQDHVTSSSPSDDSPRCSIRRGFRPFSAEPLPRRLNHVQTSSASSSSSRPRPRPRPRPPILPTAAGAFPV